MARRSLVFAAALALLVGCKMQPPAKPEPAEITGTVRTADGKAVGSVKLNLMPTSSDLNQVQTTVAPDGKFKLTAIPGKYTVMIEQSGANEQAFRLVPENYRTNEAAHAVTVAAGTPLEIVLK